MRDNPVLILTLEVLCVMFTAKAGHYQQAVWNEVRFTLVASTKLEFGSLGLHCINAGENMRKWEEGAEHSAFLEGRIITFLCVYRDSKSLVGISGKKMVSVPVALLYLGSFVVMVASTWADGSHNSLYKMGTRYVEKQH